MTISSQQFPRLIVDGYTQTSPVTPKYNCIAWAAGEDHCWWEPAVFGPYFWPEDLPRGDYSIANFVAAFTTRDFVQCGDGILEHGVEKIAIYARSDGSATHASRQLADGRWTSKLGSYVDISHTFPESLEGPTYGSVVIFMSRSRPSTLF